MPGTPTRPPSINVQAAAKNGGRRSKVAPVYALVSVVQKGRWWRVQQAADAVFLGKSLSVDDFQSLLDQLLLVDTLLLGFAIALMTQSTLGNGDYVGKDSWSIANLVDGYDGGYINSHAVAFYGQLSVTLFTIALALGIFVYVQLNVSNARESDAVFSLWSKFFFPFVVAAYACVIVGVVYFYACYLVMVEIIFPLYCTTNWVPTAAELPTVFDAATESMIPISSDMWHSCKSKSFIDNMMANSTDSVLIVIFCICAITFLVNFIVHLLCARHDEELTAEVEPSILAALQKLAPDAAEEYSVSMATNDITPEIFRKLTYEQLRDLGLSVGHAAAFSLMPAGERLP